MSDRRRLQCSAFATEKTLKNGSAAMSLECSSSSAWWRLPNNMECPLWVISGNLQQVSAMSALTPKADIHPQIIDVRFVPEADITECVRHYSGLNPRTAHLETNPNSKRAIGGPNNRTGIARKSRTTAARRATWIMGWVVYLIIYGIRAGFQSSGACASESRRGIPKRGIATTPNSSWSGPSN